MDTVLIVLVTGALTSATFALLAVGFSLVFGVGGTINLAHGTYFMAGAYAAYAGTEAGLPLGIAAVVGVAAAALLGLAVDILVVAPAHGAHLPILIGTLAAAIAIESVVRIVYGADTYRLPAFADGAVSVLGVRVLTAQLVAAGASVLVLATLFLVLERSPVGRVVRAAAQDGEAARLMGIRTELVGRWVMVTGAALTGLAGVLVTPYQTLDPLMWLAPLTTALAVVVLGGLGSLVGTVVAAGVLGLLDRLVAEVVPDGETWVGLVTTAVILGTLVLRPRGLAGKAIA